MQKQIEESNIAQWVSEHPKYARVIRHPKNKWFFGAVIPPRNSKEDEVWNHLVKKMHNPESDKLTGSR